MTEYKLTSLFQSVRDSNFPYLNEDSKIREGVDKVTLLVTPDNVGEVELYIFDKFLEALSIDSNSGINYGVVTFENEICRGHCPGFIGLNSEGVLGLRIGADINEVAQSLFIPFEKETFKKKVGKKTIDAVKYSLNSVELSLKEMLDNEGKPTGKFYINTETYTDDHYDNYEFSIPFLINKDKTYTSAEINKAWITGQFDTVCREFGNGTGSNRWIKANKAFISSFEQKTFPSGGVYILARNGRIKITPAGSHPNIKEDIVVSEWEIIDVSHPELLIDFYVKKERDVCSLDEATHIEFTTAKNNNEGYTFLVNNGIDQYSRAVLIHIVRSNSNNVKHTPVNIVTNLLPRVAAKVMKSPNLTSSFAGIKDELVNITTGMGMSKKPLLPASENPDVKPVMPNLNGKVDNNTVDVTAVEATDSSEYDAINSF